MKSTYFLDSMRQQEKWRQEDSINLLPSENSASPQVRALLSSDFSNRYTLPLDSGEGMAYVENAYRGTRITTDVERKAEELACKVYKAKHSCVQPMGGHIAALIAIKALTKRGDGMCAVAPEHGGYDGYAPAYIPDIYGLKAWALPFDQSTWNLETESAVREIRKRKPGLVILGASFLIFPYDMKPVREACDDIGAKLAYDGSHVMGLIAGGGFQQPLKEGADILYGSTHKSFFGPQGGIILADSDEVDAGVRKNLTWRIVDNVHWNRVAALGQALLEMDRFGPAYAKQVVRNSKRLGKELSERGFPLKFADMGFSESHQLLIDVPGLEKKYGMSLNDFSVMMEKTNLITDSVGRLGTCEITRLGVKEKDLPELADIFMDGAGGKDVRRKVKRFRARLDMDYRFR